MITVYYDGQCGLCRREIAYYKRIQPVNVFNWVDITQNADVLKEHNITLVAALKHLHVLDNNKQLKRGLDAFLVIWQALGGFWRFMSIVMAWPGVRHLGYWGYTLFAQWRFNRLAHCQCALQAENEK